MKAKNISVSKTGIFILMVGIIIAADWYMDRKKEDKPKRTRN